MKRTSAFGTLFLFTLLAVSAGCTNYTTSRTAAQRTGGMRVIPAPFAAKGECHPTISFPATLAFAPIADIPSYSNGVAVGGREEEQGLDFREFEALPHTDSVTLLNSMLINAENFETYYEAAASLEADVVAFYQVRSGLVYHGTTIPLLGILTLGLFPNEYREGFATASLVFVDARTGFVYGAAEASDTSWRLANGWTFTRDDESVAFRARRNALRKLFDEIPEAWNAVVQKHGPNVPTTNSEVSSLQ